MPAKQARIIYHMTPAALWDVQSEQPYFTPTSLVEEGFIHCTAEPEKLQQVANTFYRDQREPFIILCIIPERLEFELRWEMADNHLFPHIYGPLNRSSIVRTVPFPRLPNDEFVLPEEIRAPAV